MNRRTVFVLAGALVLAVTGQAWAAPNFSGSWKLNSAKSDFGPIPVPEKLERKITHEDPSLKITTTQTGSQGEVTSELSYKTDGSASVNTVRGSEVKAVAKWDGDALTIASKREMQGMEITQNENWTLSKDGKVITIVNKINTPQGDLTITVVLDKQ